MSTCLSSKDGVRARKQKWCALCNEPINVGDLKDVRSGVGDGFWTMHMHPECHRYEQSPEKPVDWEWYECGGEPAFERAEAARYVAGLTEAPQ